MQTLTIFEAAEALKVKPETIRRQLRAGKVKGLKVGKVWRIRPESLKAFEVGETAKDTPQTRAAAILAEMRSGDRVRRNAALVQLSQCDAQTVQIVAQAGARSVEKWDGLDDDFSGWRALDGEPFQFPEEAPDYLEGLYRSDAKSEDVV